MLTPHGQRPTLCDYQAAVARLEQCSEDPVLKRCRPRLATDGQPGADGGTFGAVYRLDDPQNGRGWALKCFLRDEPHRERRYREITKCLVGARGTWHTEVRYLEHGLWVRGQWWPVVLMEWVPGLRLTDWIDRLLDQRPGTAGEELRCLAHRFAGAVYQMHRSGISHGDLQSGNVLVVPGTQVRFVDYDAMTAPGWLTPPRRENGHPDFRLPHEGERGPDGATELLHTAASTGTGGCVFTTGTSTGIPLQEPDALVAVHRDRFPSHVIHASLVMLGHDVSLWDALHRPGSDHLLLSRADFRDPAGSPAWHELLHHRTRGVRDAAAELRALLDCPADLQPDLEPRPEVASDETILRAMALRPEAEPPPATRRPFLDMDAFTAPGSRLGVSRTPPSPGTAGGIPQQAGARHPVPAPDPAAQTSDPAERLGPGPDRPPHGARPGGREEPVQPRRDDVRPVPLRPTRLVIRSVSVVLLLAVLAVALSAVLR
ncbi:hypothetical protein ACPC37_12675 [Streptomyces griseoincarnatus]